MHTAAASVDFKPARTVSNQDPHQFSDRATHCRSTGLIGHPLRGNKVEKSRFSSFAASRLGRRYLLPTAPSLRTPTSLQRTAVRGSLRSSGPSSCEVVQLRKGIWVRRTLGWVRRCLPPRKRAGHERDQRRAARGNPRSSCRPRPQRATRHRGAECRFEHRCSGNAAPIELSHLLKWRSRRPAR